MVRSMTDGGSRARNITWQPGRVTRADREARHGHRGVAIWLTGLSGSGKSTLAHGIEEALVRRGVAAYVLDGDNVRHGLNSDLGFAPEERSENLRRVGEVAKLFLDAGMVVLCAFVSPTREDRGKLRALIGARDFVEVHVRASLATCRARDPKGLYSRAERGEITNLTGVGAPYEPPEHPDLVLDTEQRAPDENVELALRFLAEQGYVTSLERSA
jgi:adenylylsulfate kinase